MQLLVVGEFQAQQHTCGKSTTSFVLFCSQLFCRPPQQRNMSEESSNPFLGKPISLVTKAGLRYEGKLYTVVCSFSRAHPAVTAL
jgi:hypothetical protein